MPCRISVCTVLRVCVCWFRSWRLQPSRASSVYIKESSRTGGNASDCPVNCKSRCCATPMSPRGATLGLFRFNSRGSGRVRARTFVTERAALTCSALLTFWCRIQTQQPDLPGVLKAARRAGSHNIGYFKNFLYACAYSRLRKQFGVQ